METFIISKRKYLLLIFVFSFNILFAQSPLVKQWDKRFGGNKQDWLHSFVIASDGGYFLAGYSRSDSSGDKSQYNWNPSSGSDDFWVVKTDSLGNKIWDKNFGGMDYDDLRSMQRTNDGGYILAGGTISGVGGDKSEPSWGLTDYWMIKIDSTGNKEWDKRFGGTGHEYHRSVGQTDDGGYILGGFTSTGISGDKTQPTKGDWDYWIVKTDSLGNKLWDKDYGGSDKEILSSVIQTRDKGYIVAGSSLSGISGDKTEDSRDTTTSTINYRGDYWIVKTDSLGNKIWDKRYGGFINDYLSSVCETFDNGYILSGLSYSDSSGDKSQISHGGNDYWVVKIDSAGNKQWDMRFGGLSSEGAYDAFIFQTTDSGYVISGASSSPISGDKTESNLGGQQCWIVKIDSLGNKMWDKTIQTIGFERLCYAIQRNEKSYTFGLYTTSGIGGEKHESSQGQDDYWIINYLDTTNYVQSVAFSVDDSSYCGEHCFNFTDLSINSPTFWAWSFPGASPDTSNVQNPQQICYNTPGTFTVSLLASNMIDSSIAVYPNFITIYGTPNLPYISISGPNGDTLTSTPALYYQWNINGQPIPGATSPIYVAQTSGTYTVTATDVNNCSATSFPVVVTGLSNNSYNLYLNVITNPVFDDLELEIGLASRENVNFSIINPIGQEILSYKKSIPFGRSKEILYLSNLNSGIYFLTVKLKNDMIIRKIIKE